MPISVGTKAPDFKLKSKNATGLVDVQLSTHFAQKNVVLLFVPLAFTGVIGVSVDSPFAQEAWATQSKIGITLVSDLNKETTKAYGVLFPMLAGVGDTSARAAFVIGKDGVIHYAEQTATPKDLPNFAAVKDILAKLS